MNSTDITVFYSTARVEAMERILKEQGKSLDSAVLDMLDDLYHKIVPELERNPIEAAIRQEEAQSTAEREASRRFAVYHIREQAGDSYFYSDVHNDLYMAACECRQYLQEGKQFLLSEYFKHRQDCDFLNYAKLLDDMGYNPQITMAVELNADTGLCMVRRAGADGSWHQYRMKDLSTGIFHAKRKDGLSFERRNVIFEECIAEKEIALHRPAYDYREQLGKSILQRLGEFDAGNAPFYLTNCGGGRYELSIPITFMEPPYSNFGQKAFDAYAVQSGEPVKRDGLFTCGNGYDWQAAFEKAFENEPLLEKLHFDCEAGGFHTRSNDLSALEQLGGRFREICEDGQAFRELVCTALAEAELKQKMQWGGM